jgi:phosphoglycerate dehydrogenase-like enzyme
MKVLFAAEEHAWGGILNKFRHALPDVEFVAAGDYDTQSLQGFDVLIPTMTKIDARLLATTDQLKLIQQIGAVWKVSTLRLPSFIILPLPTCRPIYLVMPILSRN